MEKLNFCDIITQCSIPSHILTHRQHHHPNQSNFKIVPLKKSNAKHNEKKRKHSKHEYTNSSPRSSSNYINYKLSLKTPTESCMCRVSCINLHLIYRKNAVELKKNNNNRILNRIQRHFLFDPNIF